MFENMENCKILYPLHKKNKPFVTIQNRKHHTFFIRTGGNVVCDFYYKKILVNEGDVLFIPKGASYTVTSLCENTTYTSIHFEADFSETPYPAAFPLDDFTEAEYITTSFCDMWNFGGDSEKYQCISLFYSLLSHISKLEKITNFDDNKFKLIEPAIIYLKNHIYDQDLKTEKLYLICGISSTHFRNLFQLKFNNTTKNYIISKRLSHAKAIINSGDFNTIEEVAFTVGFNDPLYFSKAFKKKYGVPPSQFNNF